MPVSRLNQRFPTRNFPYRPMGGLEADEGVGDAVGGFAPPLPNTLHRMVVGLDAAPRPMTGEELSGLDDPLARLLKSGRPFPLTLHRLLTELSDPGSPAGPLPNQLVFLVADGGHVPWSPATDTLQRAFRMAIARGGSGDFPVLISSSTAVESADDQAFLQIIGWDATHEVFHYYERRAGTFFWAGMSQHALEDATRGQGPFDSHVNGSLVMKELRSPWIHWHAPQAGINEEALAPDDPFRREPLFQSRVTAERLETEIVRPGIRRWNESRVRKARDADGTWPHVRRFLRQMITDTTVNLATSEVSSGLLDTVPALPLPLSFFINRDTFFDSLGLVPDDVETMVQIPSALYRDRLRHYDVHRTDGAIRLEGDSHFGFITPEPAFEDTHLIDAMLQAELITPRFTACISMTDFVNPVFSPRRAALLRYVPETVSGADPAAALEEAFVAAVTAAINAGENGAALSDSPEREFLAHWQTADFEQAFVQQISGYFAALQRGREDPAVVDGWFRLAESRRRLFRKRKLAEFELTTPRTNIPENAPVLKMTREGRVVPVS